MVTSIVVESDTFLGSSRLIGCCHNIAHFGHQNCDSLLRYESECY